MTQKKQIRRAKALARFSLKKPHSFGPMEIKENKEAYASYIERKKQEHRSLGGHGVDFLKLA